MLQLPISTRLGFAVIGEPIADKNAAVIQPVRA